MTTVTSRRANGALNPTYCRSCHALVGYHYGERSPSIFCPDPICPVVPPTNSFAERDGLIVVLKQTGWFSKERLGALVGLSRQRITQILAEGSAAPTPLPQNSVALPRARPPAEAPSPE